MKWNTKLNILQFFVATIGIIQLLNGAMLSVFAVYGIGAFENGGAT